MASKEYYFSGIAKWAKVYKPDEKYHNWSIQLYPDQASIELYAKTGMTVRFKEDADGKYLTFRRPQSKLIGTQNVSFEAPKVVDKDGTAFTQTIGNGSQVTVKVLVYDLKARPGVGHRLEAVRVDEHVEYKPPEKPAEETSQTVSSTIRPF